MHEPDDENHTRRLRVGSRFSGHGGLDLTAEEVFDARTTSASEINEPVARVFADHWPDVPNLGNITSTDWRSPSSPSMCSAGASPARTSPPSEI